MLVAYTEGDHILVLQVNPGGGVVFNAEDCGVDDVETVAVLLEGGGERVQLAAEVTQAYTRARNCSGLAGLRADSTRLKYSMLSSISTTDVTLSVSSSLLSRPISSLLVMLLLTTSSSRLVTSPTPSLRSTTFFLRRAGSSSDTDRDMFTESSLAWKIKVIWLTTGYYSS